MEEELKKAVAGIHIISAQVDTFNCGCYPIIFQNKINVFVLELTYKYVEVYLDDTYYKSSLLKCH